MKNILTFDNFSRTNEEINFGKLGKAATTAALGASMALSSPTAKALPAQSTAIEQAIPSDMEWSEVIEMPGMGAQEIELHINNLLLQLAKNPQTRTTQIKSLKWVPGSTRITADVVLNVSPTGIAGDTYCQLEFIVKPGKYKIMIKETKLISGGSSQVSSTIKPLIGPAVADAARRAVGNRMGPAGQVLGNVLASRVHDAATRPSTNPAQKRDRSSTLTDEDYKDWAEKMEKTTSLIFGYFADKAEDASEEDF